MALSATFVASSASEVIRLERTRRILVAKASEASVERIRRVVGGISNARAVKGGAREAAVQRRPAWRARGTLYERFALFPHFISWKLLCWPNPRRRRVCPQLGFSCVCVPKASQIFL
jgi:hypothetical protein